MMKEDREIFTDGIKTWYVSGKTKLKIWLDERQCERCSKTFLSSIKQPQKFCSNECIFDRNQEGTKLIGEIGQGKRQRVKEVPCEFCGKIRTVRASRKTRFCGTACRVSFARANGRGTLLDLTCPICKIDFKRAEWTTKGYVHHYCSKKCSDIGRRKESGLYGDTIGRISRKALFRFLKPECVSCGENRKFLLDIHHIDGNSKNNPWDGSNWEMLCSRCHDIRHLKLKPDGTWVRNLSSLTPREMIPILSDPDFGIDCVPPLRRLQQLYETDPLEELSKIA